MQAASPFNDLDPRSAAFRRAMLPCVSRTFALTIPVLLPPLRDEVELAYLACRVVDTVEDHPDLAQAERDTALHRFLRLLRRGDAESERAFQEAVPPHPSLHEETLLRAAGPLLEARATFRPEARKAIDACLTEMAEGMTGFPGLRDGARVSACTSLEDLEAYCHVVAGTVGILLSRLFRAWVPSPPEGWSAFRESGRRFGLGLQLTNVLKDRAGDGRRGIRYLPPADADGPDALLHTVVRCALGHLDAGHRYILTLPPERKDLRLFCLWAHHLALATLRVNVEENAGDRNKVRREEVGRILDAAQGAVTDDEALERLYDGYRAAVLERLPATPMVPDRVPR